MEQTVVPPSTNLSGRRGDPLPPLLSFTQKSGEVMELGRSLAKKAFRAKKNPPPRAGEGQGGGAIKCSDGIQ